jgi:hypothetical protein
MNKNNDDIVDDYSDLMRRQTPRPNRFVAVAASLPRFAILPNGARQEVRTVHLDEDVAQFFPTSESINNVLRAILDALPNATATHLDDYPHV